MRERERVRKERVSKRTKAEKWVMECGGRYLGFEIALSHTHTHTLTVVAGDSPGEVLIRRKWG